MELCLHGCVEKQALQSASYTCTCSIIYVRKYMPTYFSVRLTFYNRYDC